MTYRNLESASNEEEEGQFEDIQTYLDHHNTQKEYTKRLLDLDDERYYRDIDHMYDTYSQD